MEPPIIKIRGSIEKPFSTIRNNQILSPKLNVPNKEYITLSLIDFCVGCSEFVYFIPTYMPIIKNTTPLAAKIVSAINKILDINMAGPS